MVEGACAMDINSCVKASVEPKGNSMPVVPSLMSSQFEGQSLAIGGTPAAIASTMVPAKPSVLKWVGKSKAKYSCRI